MFFFFDLRRALIIYECIRFTGLDSHFSVPNLCFSLSSSLEYLSIFRAQPLRYSFFLRRLSSLICKMVTMRPLLRSSLMFLSNVSEETICDPLACSSLRGGELRDGEVGAQVHTI